MSHNGSSCPRCGDKLRMITETGWKDIEEGRYWICPNGTGKGCNRQPPAPREVGPPRCPECSEQMSLRERPKRDQNELPRWYCEEHRRLPAASSKPPGSRQPPPCPRCELQMKAALVDEPKTHLERRYYHCLELCPLDEDQKHQPPKCPGCDEPMDFVVASAGVWEKEWVGVTF